MEKKVFRFKKGDLFDPDVENMIMMELPLKVLSDDLMEDTEKFTQNVEIIIRNWRSK